MLRMCWAILCDSFREALDRKLLVLLFFLTALPILFCWGISFEREALPETLKNLGQRLNRFYGGHHGTPRAGKLRRHQLNVTIAGVTPVAEDGHGPWPEEVQGGHVLDLAFTEPEKFTTFLNSLSDYVRKMRRAQKNKPPVEQADEAQTEPGLEEKKAFLTDRFQRFGFNHVVIRQVAEDKDHFLIAVKGDYPHEILGGHRLNLVFGLFSDIPMYHMGMSVADFTIRLQIGLSEVLAGVFVMVVVIIATASFIPNMLQKGTLDLVLARPIGRGQLLLYKYMGGLWFIFFFSLLLIGGCWIAISVKTGFWNPWFLFSAVTLTLIFSVLYTISVLLGMLTRSGNFAAMVTLGIWVLSSSITGLRALIQIAVWGAEVPQGLVTTFDVAYWILPKISDIGNLSVYALSKSHLSEGAYRRLFAKHMSDVNWAASLGTTILFAACMLGLACFFFKRRDY